jgi:hypothetical protein
MPIRNYPFTPVRRDFARPMVWIRVVNPTKNLAFIALAIVDTGADECVFPARTAISLGHNSDRRSSSVTRDSSDEARATGHEFRRESFLLGCRQFLSNFILEVNYPRQVFSLRYPPKSIR